MTTTRVAVALVLTVLIIALLAWRGGEPAPARLVCADSTRVPGQAGRDTTVYANCAWAPQGSGTPGSEVLRTGTPTRD